MSEAVLRSCPFCGGDDLGYGDRTSLDGFFVFCRGCGTEGPVLEDEESLQGAWNKRPTEDALVEGLGQVIAEEDEYGACFVPSSLLRYLKAALAKARGEVAQ